MRRRAALLAFLALLGPAAAPAFAAFDGKTGLWAPPEDALAEGAAGEFVAVIACPEGPPRAATLAWRAPILGVIPFERTRTLALRCDGRPRAYRVAFTEADAPRAGEPTLRFTGPAEGPAPEARYASLVPRAEDMAYIPPGPALLGSAWDDLQRGPLEPGRPEKRLPGYWIDLYEYPNRMGSMPRTLVGYDEAAGLCAAAGKRLCSQDEWEAACAGPEGSRFAGGDAFDAAACEVTGEDDAFPRAYPSGSRPSCASGWGVYDLGGNVSELVADRMPVSFAESKGFPWLRGANWSTPEASARCAARDHFHYGSLNGNEAFYNDGFRCCADRPIVRPPTVPIAAAPRPAEPREDWLRHKGKFIHIRDKSVSPEIQRTIAAMKPAKDPRAGMVRIPAGPFKMGSPEGDEDRDPVEWPMREVFVPEFWIDVYEFPNRKGERPVTSVTWYEARALCEAAGKRLCAEEEWEKACKGPESLKHPYGNDFDPDACDTGRPPYDLSDKGPSGAKPRCVSGWGVRDLLGNVNEWTASGYAVAYHDEVYRMLRGGDWGGSRRDLRCASRTHYHDPTQWYPDDGLRCCWSAPAAP